MKNPERVAELLAELRALAETDFERHRLDVLEKDLREPPTPEIIDETHQRFCDTIYKKDSHGHFSIGGGGLHRAVWSYFVGEIPEGYQIHHLDENKANNAIENLQCLTKAEHDKIHHQQKLALREKTFICSECGKEYRQIDNGRNKICPDCRKPTKICPVCGKEFKPFNRKARCCSYSCGAKFRYRENRVTHICPWCGKEFDDCKSHNRVYCSRDCRQKAANERRKAKNQTP